MATTLEISANRRNMDTHPSPSYHTAGTPAFSSRAGRVFIWAGGT
jgi:hypothetical protein